VDFSVGAPARDELAALNSGNPMGRVFRVVAAEPVILYDDVRPGIPPMKIGTIKPGALIVAFDDPGKLRQVTTANETFGYIERSVKLVQLDNVVPAEIYDATLRAAVEAKLPPLDAAAMRTDAQPVSKTLSNTELFVAAGLVFLIVLTAVLAALMKFGR